MCIVGCNVPHRGANKFREAIISTNWLFAVLRKMTLALVALSVATLRLVPKVTRP